MMTPDLILHNARVYTVDPNRPWAEAVAMSHGRFTAVGANREILSLAGPQTQRLDGAGRLLLPGLIDAHVHFLQFAARRQQVSLFGVQDFGEVQRLVAAAAAAADADAWIQGWGWNEYLWDVAPTAALLDAVAPAHPVVLYRLDMHTIWVNSVVLERAGITAATPDPADSRIDRDAAGMPTGILREWAAIELVEAHMPRPAPATQLAWLRSAVAEAHRLGLTGIHDQRVEREGPRSFRLFQALRREGALQLRVHMNISADFLTEAATLGLQPGFGDDTLWIGHVKAFADGTMGSRTASMLAPFEGEPDNLGLVITASDAVWQLAETAAAAGFSISVHAIGDRAVRDVLDVLSERASLDAGRRLSLPHRIEHVQLIHPDDVGRLAPLGVVASVQPVHLLTDWSTADQVWGRRARTAYAFRSLLDQGTPLALGSDAPVAPLNPLLGIYAAVTRQDAAGQPEGGWYPAEKLTVAEAIHGYTMGPAHLSGTARRQGSITPGKWADCILLEQDLFRIPPPRIPDVAVDMTLFGGRVVHAR